jgi:hypothetical protein
MVSAQVRAACAEALYVKLQTSDVIDDDEAEEQDEGSESASIEKLLLQTPWCVLVPYICAVSRF